MAIKLEKSTIELLQPWFPDLRLTDVSLVSNGPVCWYVRSVARQGMMTIAPWVFYGRETYDPDNLVSVALIAHELVHVRQYHERGHAAFLARYLWDLGRNGFRYSRELPLEAEAYALQSRVRSELGPRFARSNEPGGSAG